MFNLIIIMLETAPVYWPIALSVVALITWFVRLEYNSKENSNRIRALEIKEHDLQPVLVQLARDIAEIKTNLGWIMRDSAKQNINNSNM